MKRSVVQTLVIALAFLICACGPAVKYTYDPAASFSGRSYNWVGQAAPAWQDSLVESNVRFTADKELGKKGFTISDKPDFLISTSYEYESGYYPMGYKLQALSLNISRADTKNVLWRGTVSDCIKTDAGSSDLRKAVQKILSKFPPQMK